MIRFLCDLVVAVVLASIGTILLAIFWPAVIVSAPVPPPKPRPRPDLAGNWMAHWSGSEWPTVLLPDGTYVAERPGGPRYEGRWALAGDVLSIEERLVSPDGYGEVLRYVFSLRAGKTESTCGRLRLVPVR